MTLRLAEVLQVAGEPTRLRILNLLLQGSICVCDLEAILGLPQHMVSRHLAVLRHAGLVTDERQGQRVVYSLAAPSAPLQGLTQMLQGCSAEEVQLREDLDHLKRLLRNGECSLVTRTNRQEKTV